MLRGKRTSYDVLRGAVAFSLLNGLRILKRQLGGSNEAYMPECELWGLVKHTYFEASIACGIVDQS
jgi:hypothetical protein